MSSQPKPKAGDILTKEVQITSELIERFSEISEDKNPIHLDDKFASKTVFKKRIAHGLLSVSYISALLTQLLGNGNVILNLAFSIKAPTYVDDMIQMQLEVAKVNPNRSIDLTFQIINKGSDLLLIKGTVLCLKVY